MRCIWGGLGKFGKNLFPVWVSVIILLVSVLSSLCECPSLFYWSQFCLPCVCVNHYFTGLSFIFPVCVNHYFTGLSFVFPVCVHHYFTGLSFVFPVCVSIIILLVSVLSSQCVCVNHYFTGLSFIFPVCVCVCASIILQVLLLPPQCVRPSLLDWFKFCLPCACVSVII